jgi:hypothetical protein
MPDKKRGSEQNIPPGEIIYSDPIVRNAAGAEFSACRRWRYLLWRHWDEKKPAVNFLMLNPSTADEHKLDPTCSRARDYAERWGYGALIVTNVFGWRATDPDDMKAAKDPVGPGNDAAIVRAARESAIVVCAWGNHGAYRDRSKHVFKILSEEKIALYSLRVNANGEPAHPLYLPGRLKPTAWEAASAP